MTVKAIPEGYHSVTPYLTVDDAAEAIRFYERAFGAAELMRLPMGDKIGHAEVRVGDSVIMLSPNGPIMASSAPKRGAGPRRA